MFELNVAEGSPLIGQTLGFAIEATSTIGLTNSSFDNLQLSAPLDTDGDGIVNSLDLDSDNDGISDLTESGRIDSDNTGTISGLPAGIPDTIDGQSLAGFNFVNEQRFIDPTFSTLVDTTGLPPGGFTNLSDLDSNTGSDFTHTATISDSVAAIGLTLTNVSDAATITLDVFNQTQGTSATGTITFPDGIDALGIGDFFLDQPLDVAVGDVLEFDLSTDNPDGGDLLRNVNDLADIFNFDFSGPINNPGVRLQAVSGETEVTVQTLTNGTDTVFVTSPVDDPTQLTLLDSLPADFLSADTPLVDTDEDGTADFIDLDSDNDFIADAIEARATDAQIPLTTLADGAEADAADSDNDGVLDVFEGGASGTFGGAFTTPNDDDADGVADFLDTDSDGDGILDTAESGLTELPADVNFLDADGSVDVDPVTPEGLTNEDGDPSDLDFRSVSPPDAIDDTVVFTPGTPVTIDVLANDINDGVTDPPDLTVELIDPETGDPVTTLTVLGQGEFVVQPNGEIIFTPEGGFTGDPTPISYQITDLNGQISEPATITLLESAAIGGRIWADLDRNGIEGAFEPGVENITVSLIGGGADGDITTVDDNTTQSVVTNANGEYEFTGLIPGIDYQISIDVNSLPPEFSDGFTTQDAGSSDEFDSDVDVSTGLTPIIILNSGDAITDIDAGLLQPETDLTQSNLILGTPSPDILVGTDQDESISGFSGQDTITGGAGSDLIIFNNTADGLDVITDFTSGEDTLVLTQILETEIGFTGDDAIADGFVNVVDFGAVGTLIQVDIDGSAGSFSAINLVFLSGITNTDIDTSNDFDPNEDLIF